ncbi:hypothetical protein BGZ73_003991 [Actinomortierella ambigua]|nr:hypothetical protein BGZ73_003991 [Actinomortierella ambigua]
MSFDHDQYHAIHYVLDSDDEGFPREPSNIIDLVEDSDEELQYRWAIEDSIRVQSLSQSSISYEENEDSTRIGDETLTESIYEDIRALTSNDLSFMTDVQGTASLRKHGSALLEEQSLTDHQKRSGSSTPTMVPPKMILPELFAMDGDTATPKFDNKPSKVKDGGTDPRGDNGRSLAAHKKDDRKTDVDGRGGTQEKKDDDGDGSDSDDEDFKRAIQASLQPCSQSGVSEKEIKEQEDRDLEEAIRRSLLDREDNKENISPEDLDDKKKVKKEGVDGDGGGKQSSKRRDKHTAGADSSSNRLSFSQPVVGKRDLDLQSGGQRSGNALKRAQLRRSNTTDASTMLMSTRTRSGSSSSQAQQHASGSSSAPSSQSQSSSLQRSSSSHFEYNLRSLESRVAKKEQIQESPPLASKRWSTTKATRSATALTAPKKSDKSRPTGITSSTSSLSTPPTPTTPTTPKSAGGSYQASSSSSRSTASASRPPIISSGSSSTSSMPDKASHRQSGKHGDQAGPDGVAIQPPRGETERAGLYRLRAVVSKPSNTGSMGSSGNGQQAGYYLCDSLGSDGVWRCFDHQSVRRIGSWASMDQQRERIGYLAIYVHTV